MERLLKNLTLRSKIALFTSIMVGLSLLTLTVITILQERTYSEQELEDQARLLLGTLPYSIRDELYFVELDELRDVAEKIGESKGVDRFVIYDRDGVALADSDLIGDLEAGELLGMPGEPDQYGLMLVALSSEESLGQWDQENQQYISGRPVYLNDENIGAVAVTLSTKALDEKINTLIRQSLLLTLVVILAGMLLSIALSKQLSNPLRKLMEVSREMASGENNIRIEVNSTDEIGQLGLAFNEMTEAIQTRERSLQDLAASLEQKVEERTEELRLRSEELHQRSEELRERNEELLQMAISDPLTKIYNRRFFFELAEKEFERSKRYNHQLSLILVDVDRFKKSNDTYGHLVGDEILKNLARFLVSNVRGNDVVARYGGEEFVILMPEIGAKEAAMTAERLREEIAKNTMVVGRFIQVTVSFGVAGWEEQENTDLESLLYRADQALYRSKGLGRNRVTIWKKNFYG